MSEALECLGGNGYVEESIMPRLYREAPLYSIWEGSGNVMCLDVLRALTKDPATVDALLAELKSTAGADKRLDPYVQNIGCQIGRFSRRLRWSQRPDGKTCIGASGFIDGAAQHTGDGGGVHRVTAGRAAWACVWDAASGDRCEGNS